MGVEKQYRPLMTKGEITYEVQNLTGKSTATTIARHGVTFITVASATESATAAQYRFRLPTPVKGVRKTIAVDGGGTTREIQVVAATSGATFYGTTKNGLTFTTGSTQGQVVELIGFNSTTWAVLSGSTATAALAGVTT